MTGKSSTLSGESPSLEEDDPSLQGCIVGDSCANRISALRPSSLPPKPPPVRGPSPSPGARKRGSDEDETSRPAKRAKADANGASDDKARGHEDNVHSRGGADASRMNDSPASASNAHDKTDGKAGSSTSSSTMNGRSMLKAAMSSAHNGSPNARSRAGSLNGSRAEPSGSSKSTPVKAPPSSSVPKATVPPLLSPLHLSFDGPDSPKKAGKASKRDDQPDSQRQMAKGKQERTRPAKKAKSPLTIPPLLSPTLPPVVEEELLRRKKTGSKTAGSKSPEQSKSLKKLQVASKVTEQPKRERFMVTLKYPRRLSRRVQKLLDLPAKNEKPGAVEQQQPHQTSKKRPLQSGGPPEISGEALNTSVVGAKRPRKSDGATTANAAAPPPSTPSRPPSAVGHVDTPGESGPGSSSQPSQPLSGGQSAASAARLRQRGERYRSLGTKLKHARDDIVKRFPANQLPDAEHRLAIVTGIEATLSYMVGFRSFVELRRVERKPPDVGSWRTLVPFVTELQRQAKKLPFVYALALILHDLILQEMLTCWYFSDLRVQGAVSELQQTGTAQFGLRTKLLRVYKQAEESGLKLPALNAGVSFDEGICKALEAMTAWAGSEGLEWRATLSVDEVLAGN